MSKLPSISGDKAVSHGKISLGRLAAELDIPVSEAMDFLAEHGVAVHLDQDDYMGSIDALRKVW